ncbi:hypothetical protein CWATWH0402_3651 [Crocosphaera watsonii WH 0402]|uniref:Uncharacterized protein n=2 Tax=Crocosphaera watsonii TaxID=263511 RepID=T2JJ58_CROWT|nr:hypothetical protein CWATWH0005_4299 [Crocosphaera watsonii WH 0005]CCQ65161.1 hypothetical protein CWATWH0402_3651 [Crocosphaera watsonii WH 0402]
MAGQHQISLPLLFSLLACSCLSIVSMVFGRDNSNPDDPCVLG